MFCCARLVVIFGSSQEHTSLPPHVPEGLPRAAAYSRVLSSCRSRQVLLGCRIDDTARCAYYVSPIRHLHHVSFFGVCLDDIFDSLASLHGLVVTCGHAGPERVAVIARETSSLWAESPAVPRYTGSSACASSTAVSMPSSNDEDTSHRLVA